MVNQDLEQKIGTTKLGGLGKLANIMKQFATRIVVVAALITVAGYAFGRVPEIINPEKDREEFLDLIVDHYMKRNRVETLVRSAGETKSRLSELEEELQSISLKRVQDLFQEVQEQAREQALERSGEPTVTQVTVGLKPRERTQRLYVEPSVRRTYVPNEVRKEVDKIECTFDRERFPVVKNLTWFLATVDGVKANYEVYYTSGRIPNNVYVIKQILEEGKKRHERIITLNVYSYNTWNRKRTIYLDSFEFLEDGHTVVFKDFMGRKSFSKSDIINPEDIKVDDMNVLLGKWIRALNKPIRENIGQMDEYIRLLDNMRDTHLTELETKKKAIKVMKGKRSKTLALGPSYIPEDVTTLTELLNKTNLNLDEFIALRGAINTPDEFRAMLSSRGIKYDKTYGNDIGYAAPLNVYNYKGGVCDELAGLIAAIFAGKKQWDVYIGEFWGKVNGNNEGHTVALLHNKVTDKWHYASNLSISSTIYDSRKNVYQAARIFSGYSPECKTYGPKKIKYSQKWLANNRQSNKNLRPGYR